MARWLKDFPATAESFDWDAGNRGKNAKHGVSDEAIEGLFRQPTVFVGRVTEPAQDEPRWLLLGIDATQRHLALILTRRDNRIRPISCRPMRTGEKRIYEESCEEEKR